MYVLTTARSDEIGVYAGTLAEAITWARKRLEDDPEAGTLELYQIGLGNAWRHVRTITFAPDADWQSVVVDLEPGEKIAAPLLPPAVDEDAYEITDPKHPKFPVRLSEFWDSREKV